MSGQVVHHHHYYGGGAPVPVRARHGVRERPPVRPVRSGLSPALCLFGGALAVVAVVVAVAVATTLLVVGGGLVLVVGLGVREYVRMSREAVPVRRSVGR